MVFIQLFNSFPHTVVKWRFGTLAAVCKDLAEVEVPLRRFWNSARLQFQQAARQNQEEAHARAADGAFGDNRLEGPSIFKAGEAVLSNTFWSWVHMICSLASCIGYVEAWFESCPCHSDPQGRDRMRLFGKISCPLKKFRAPELACQEFRPFLDELAMLSAAEVAFKHTVFCNDADRAWILEDFEAGRQHLQFNLTMQTSCWTHLPHRLCCLGHFDENVAQSEAAECLRIWVGMSQTERQCAHPWSKELLGVGTELGQQFRDFIRGGSLTDPGFARLASVAGKFQFIPLSEKPIEGRHAVIHKVLKKASNAGPVFLSMAERMPLLMKWSLRDVSLIADLAKKGDSLYHPLQASVTLGLSCHPDLAPLVANVLQEQPDFGSCMVWGATHKYAKVVKKVVYHVDSTSQFMSLSGVPAMDFGNKKTNKARSSIDSAYSFEERAAFQKLLDVHQASNAYTIDRSSSFSLQPLNQMVQGHAEIGAMSHTQGDMNMADADLLFDFQPDGDSAMQAVPSRNKEPGTEHLLAFRILSLRSTRLKLPVVDKDAALIWSDIAASILPVRETSNINFPDASIIVGSCPEAPGPESVSVLSRGGFATIRIWDRDPKLHCSFDPLLAVNQSPRIYRQFGCGC